MLLLDHVKIFFYENRLPSMRFKYTALTYVWDYWVEEFFLKNFLLKTLIFELQARLKDFY